MCSEQITKVNELVSVTGESFFMFTCCWHTSWLSTIDFTEVHAICSSLYMQLCVCHLDKHLWVWVSESIQVTGEIASDHIKLFLNTDIQACYKITIFCIVQAVCCFLWVHDQAIHFIKPYNWLNWWTNLNESFNWL